MGKLISISEAAARLGVSGQTIKNWGAAGVIPILGLNASERKYWLEEDVINALGSTAQDVGQAEQKMQVLRKKLKREQEELELLERDTRRSLRLARYANGLIVRENFYLAIIRLAHVTGCINDKEENIISELCLGKSFREVAEMYGHNSEWVSLIFARACRKMGSLAENIARIIDDNTQLRAERDNALVQVKASREAAVATEVYDTMQKAILARELFVTTDERCVELKRLRDMPLKDMDISVRAINCLRNMDIDTFGQLVACHKTDLLRMRNFGKRSFRELTDLIESVRLDWGDDIDELIKMRVNERFQQPLKIKEQ